MLDYLEFVMQFTLYILIQGNLHYFQTVVLHLGNKTT